MDDVRLRLLALLPLATGAGVLVYRLIVATIPNTPTGTPMAAATLWPPRSFYELHGVEKCAPEPPPPAQLTSPSDRKAGTAVVLPEGPGGSSAVPHGFTLHALGAPVWLSPGRASGASSLRLIQWSRRAEQGGAADDGGGRVEYGESVPAGR